MCPLLFFFAPFSFILCHLVCSHHLLYLFLSYRLTFVTISLFGFSCHFRLFPVCFCSAFLVLSCWFCDCTTSWYRGCTCSVPSSVCVWSAKPVLSSFASGLSRTPISVSILPGVSSLLACVEEAFYKYRKYQKLIMSHIHHHIM